MTVTVDHQLLKYTDYNSFVELFERQAARYHDRVFGLCQLPDRSEDEFNNLTYGELNRISNYLAHEWSSQLDGVQYVGLISNEPIQSLVVMLTVLKLGRVFNPISAWNSETAITDSLTSTRTQYLIASEECSQLARTSVKGTPIPYVKVLESFDLKHLTMLSSGYDNSTRSSDRPPAKLNDIILTICSSGTTGTPKPYHLSNQWLILAVLAASQENKIDSNPCYELNDTFVTTSALFYGVGFITHWSPIVAGSKVFIFHKSPRNTQDITHEILSIVTKCNATMLSISPLQLEKLAKYIKAEGDNEATTALLRRFKFCLYGGVELSREIGDFLHSKGLNLRCAYGLTEVGAVGASDLSRDNSYWYAIKTNSFISNYCRWEPFGDGLYHLMIRGDCPTLCPAVTKKYGPDGYYPTNDLFQEVAPMSNHWRHIRRLNITVTMSTGVKIDPLPLESKILEARIIKRCMIFGDNRSHLGVLIELDMEQVSNYQLDEITSEVYEAVTISARKTAAHEFGVIAVPEMVYILPAQQELPITPAKGTIARKEAVEQFKTEIDEMYKKFGDSR
ncbi:hypothetical protein BJV82DRAFT_711549 [Fennellomyces sp. T-0311]|nr:hypothetical protein BJV82DRAFT_711549 [Fennellomyces sp. T-0311]